MGKSIEVGEVFCATTMSFTRPTEWQVQEVFQGIRYSSIPHARLQRLDDPLIQKTVALEALQDQRWFKPAH